MIRRILVLTALLATAAANAHFPLAQRLRQLDTNHDRALSLTEALTARQARFVALDLDRSQTLTLAEISSKINAQMPNAKRPNAKRPDARRPDAKQNAFERVGERFYRLDKNRDGYISRTEWDDKVADLFARFDVNNDRLITRPEVRSARQAKRARR